MLGAASGLLGGAAGTLIGAGVRAVISTGAGAAVVSAIRTGVQTVTSKVSSALSSAGSKVGNAFKPGASALKPGGAGKPGGSGSGTVWDDITPTQPSYPGSSLPTSFELTAGDSRVWVNGNATEHLAEYLSGISKSGAGPGRIDMATQAGLTSLQSAVGEATRGGLAFGQMYRIGGWELKFGPPRVAGQLPALFHALLR